MNVYKRRAQVLFAVVAFSIFAAACDRTEQPTATPVLTPTPVVGTPTPTTDTLTKNRVREIFNAQVQAIKQNDWEAVYAYCSPSYKSGRTFEVFNRTNSRLFTQDGYTVAGFEARNVDPSIRAAGRVRVKWDAYQDGQFVRTQEVGQVYLLVQGRWYDEGAWCR